MAFDAEPTRTPDSIDSIVVILKDAFDEEGTPYQSASFQIEIVLSDGTETKRRGDLAPHITVAQRNALMSFMDDLRTQAETQIL